MHVWIVHSSDSTNVLVTSLVASLEGPPAICKFTNRKYAQKNLYCGKNLKDVEIYGENSRIYISNSFCDEFKYLNFLIRKAKDKEIVKWRIKRGINLIQVSEGEEFVEITHKLDLIKLGIVKNES